MTVRRIVVTDDAATVPTTVMPTVRPHAPDEPCGDHSGDDGHERLAIVPHRLCDHTHRTQRLSRWPTGHAMSDRHTDRPGACPLPLLGGSPTRYHLVARPSSKPSRQAHSDHLDTVSRPSEAGAATVIPIISMPSDRTPPQAVGASHLNVISSRGRHISVDERVEWVRYARPLVEP